MQEEQLKTISTEKAFPITVVYGKLVFVFFIIIQSSHYMCPESLISIYSGSGQLYNADKIKSIFNGNTVAFLSIH